MKNYHFTVAIWQEGKSFVSKCPELGIASYGETPEQARAALTEAVELYISNAEKIGTLKDIEPSIISPARYTSSIEVATT